ncbi:MAG: response regulator transcription factor [Massilia sp.]
MILNHAGPRALIDVILVEDHKTMLWGLQRLVGDAHTGMRVVATASRADEARARVAEFGADVVLLDLDLDGYCALPLIPELLAGGARRVLVLTGTRDEALLDAAVRAGARGVVGKDAPAEQVLKAIEKVHAGEVWLDNDTLVRLLVAANPAAVAPRADPERDKQASLTARELRIIQALVAASGASNRAIAESLFISEHTLRNHLVAIYRKLDVKSRLELYVYALRHHLGDDDDARARAGV